MGTTLHPTKKRDGKQIRRGSKDLGFMLPRSTRWRNAMKKISIPSGLWYENKEWELTLPANWQVDNLDSPGFDQPGLSPGQVRHPPQSGWLDE